MTKKVCISGYYGFDNFGDETILKILIENLKSFEAAPQITVFSSNPEKTAKIHNVKSVKSFDLKAVLKELLKSDCLISGGGSLLQDATSTKSLIYYLGVIAIAAFFRKKIIIFAQGIGPINNKLLAKLTAFLLKRAEYITVRDENSLNLLNSWKVNAEKCSDPVWNLNLTKSTYSTGKIGIQLRDFPTMTEEFLNKLADKINNYYNKKEINIFSLQNNIDLDVCIKLKDKLLSINPDLNIKVIENTSNENLISDICSMDELIAMRFHACLTAIKAGIKVLPLSYDIKVETLAKTFNIPFIDIQNIEEISQIFEEYANKNIQYNQEEIKKLQFDFTKLEEKI